MGTVGQAPCNRSEATILGEGWGVSEPLWWKAESSLTVVGVRNPPMWPWVGGRHARRTQPSSSELSESVITCHLQLLPPANVALSVLSFVAVFLNCLLYIDEILLFSLFPQPGIFSLINLLFF